LPHILQELLDDHSGAAATHGLLDRLDATQCGQCPTRRLAIRHAGRAKLVRPHRRETRDVIVQVALGTRAVEPPMQRRSWPWRG
jgi:hypothetical protein